jgi:hypothetical protein
MFLKPFKSATVAVALTAALAGAPAHAGILFQDNFDADNTSSALNFNSLRNWTVSDGTIDYIRSGGFGISCVGGTGGCLDMDGSTSNAGRITSNQSFTFTPGVNYFIDVALSGNQRGGGSDSVVFGIVDTNNVEIQTIIGPLSAGAPFATFGATLAAQPGSWRLFVEGVGGDNVGLILDNVVLRDDSTTSVPEPETLLLFSLGLLAASAARSRKSSC